jgi:hypothetical protein
MKLNIVQQANQLMNSMIMQCQDHTALGFVFLTILKFDLKGKPVNSFFPARRLLYVKEPCCPVLYQGAPNFWSMTYLMSSLRIKLKFNSFSKRKKLVAF